MSRLALVLAAAVVAVVAAGALALVLVRELPDSSHPGDEIGPDAGVSQGDAAPTSTPDPNTFPGIPIQQLSLVGETPLPAGLVVYYGVYRINADGGGSSLVRAYRDSAGRLWVDDLLSPLNTDGAYVLSLASHLDAGTVFAVVCARGDCGGMAEPSADAQWRGYLSRDSGVSWIDTGLLAPRSLVNGLRGEDALLAVLPPEPDGRARFLLWPSGVALEPPPGVPDAWPYRNVLGGWFWSEEPSPQFVGQGQPIPPGVVEIHSLVSRFPGDVLASTWKSAEPAQPDALKRRFFGVFGPKLAPLAVYEMKGYAPPQQVLSAGLLIGGGRVDGPAPGESRPALALFDLKAGTVAPIGELSRSHPPQTGPQLLDALLMPNLARANIPGDCLNIRKAPSLSAELASCAAHGVLLRRTGRSETADGVEWVEVIAVSGPLGWASRPYLLW